MKNNKFLTTILIPLHIFALFGILLTDFSLTYFLIGYILIGGLGVEVGLHRWASHKSVKLKDWVKPIVVYLSILGCQGHPIWWAAIHRGYHHKNTDTDKDIHSPVYQGFYHAFIGWILKHDPNKVNYKYSVELLRDNLLSKTHVYYEIIIWVTWTIAFLVSPSFLIWAILVPTLIAFHNEGLVNSICHLVGYRNFNTEDNSKNFPPLGYLMWGNGWHNNHHHKPNSYDFGKSVSNKWWEIDPCVIFLPFIKK